MNKVKKILVLGVWVSILPYLGFPLYFKNILISISGLLIIYLGYVLYKDLKIGEESQETETYDSFSENKNFTDTEPIEENNPNTK